MTRLTLSRAVSLAVLARARTAADHHEDLGCSILGPPSRPVRAAHAALKRRIQQLGPDEAARQAPDLVRWMEASPRYAALCRGTATRLGRRLLRDDVLYPDPTRHVPRVLHLRRDELGLDVPVRTKDWPTVQALFATLAQGATKEELRPFSGLAATAELLADLRGAGWLERFDEGVRPTRRLRLRRPQHDAAPGEDAARAGGPVLPPGERARPAAVPADAAARRGPDRRGAHHPLARRPLSPGLAAAAAARRARLRAPGGAREPLLHRLRAAARAAGLHAGRGARAGAHRAPWATSASRPCPSTASSRPAAPASTGPLQRRHHLARAHAAPPRPSSPTPGTTSRGDMREVAGRCREGRPDVLFCGVRGFKVKPIFFGFSTLDAFLVDVPLDALTTPQQLMADGETALDVRPGDGREDARPLRRRRRALVLARGHGAQATRASPARRWRAPRTTTSTPTRTRTPSG